jgi:hypothetical protein
VKQDAHRQATLFTGFDRNRTGTTAGRGIILRNPFRHFSSPDELGLVIRIAAPE